METSILLNTVDTSACGCCHMNEDTDLESSCAERSKVFTSREMEVLQKIREYSGRAREVRHLIEKMDGNSESLSLKKSALDELDRLRAERTLLEKERLAAAEERMRWLGHA
jgi:hypothetical protein